MEWYIRLLFCSPNRKLHFIEVKIVAVRFRIVFELYRIDVLWHKLHPLFCSPFHNCYSIGEIIVRSDSAIYFCRTQMKQDILVITFLLIEIILFILGWYSFNFLLSEYRIRIMNYQKDVIRNEHSSFIYVKKVFEVSWPCIFWL